MPQPIYLIQQFFIHKDKKRQKELEFCLKFNLMNPLIHKIILLNERGYSYKEMGIDSPPFLGKAMEKIHQVNEYGKRLTYLRAFQYMHQHLQTVNGSPGHYILANTDIFFNNTLNKLNCYCNPSVKWAICLGRYEYSKLYKNLGQCKIAGITRSGYSQDAWIFHSSHLPIISGAFQQKLQFEMGVPGCDNRIAHLMFEMGLRIVNPMKAIHSYHLHSEGGRNYGNKRIGGPYKHIPMS